MQGECWFCFEKFFFLLCRWTFSSLSFLNCSVQDVVTKFIVSNVLLYKLGQELVLLHEIKWALMWR
jgi:hypothetical protein